MVLSLSTASWSPLNQKQIMSPTLYKTENWNLYPCITVIQAVKAKVVIPWMLSRREFEPLSWLQGIHTCLTEVREKVIKGVKGKQQRATITLSAGLCCLVTGTEVTLRFLQDQSFLWFLSQLMLDFCFIRRESSAGFGEFYNVWRQHCTGALSYMQGTAKILSLLLIWNIYTVYYTGTYFICIIDILVAQMRF